MFVDMAMKQNTHEVLIGMPLSGWHLKCVFICLWTRSTPHYLKPSSQENNITRGSGRWMKASYFIAQKNVHSGKASLSLLFLLGAQEVLSIFKSRQGTLLGSLSETLLSWLAFWAQIAQSLGGKRLRGIIMDKRHGVSAGVTATPTGESELINSGIAPLTVTPTCFHNWKKMHLWCSRPLRGTHIQMWFPYNKTPTLRLWHELKSNH